MAYYLRLSVSILVMLTLVMYLVCVSTDYWQKTHYKYSSISRHAIKATHSGIWSGCFIKGNTEYCGHIHLEKHWLKAVRAFMILGIIANMVAAIYTVLAFIKENIRFQIVGVILIINALFILIGLAVYAAKSGLPFERTYEDGKFEWSFIVAWITWVLTIVACVLSFLDERVEPQFQDY
ncbi:lens fiber membrane intrinsic protein-like [Hydractinia symbiolongicarpus]|uniref:lens fiber membrane intrinsic protein-like n=1 Tax=Hydractinia symbiolongicarpus TaxID=13093 RepID=UPI00254CE3CC|nr:lens fiber membrane intrinsic protein-like [Hydractinia symbiolongicarpus]